jgi:ketosteroid isomerase-like protein
MSGPTFIHLTLLTVERDTGLAMSEENVEVVRQVLEHWERHEWAGGRELYDDHCEVVFSTDWLPDPGAYVIGREALGAWISFLDSFEELTIGVDRIVDAGKSVVALSWIRARGRASGAAVDAKVGCIFTVRDGKVVRYELTDRHEALEATGLLE